MHMKKLKFKNINDEEFDIDQIIEQIKLFLKSDTNSRYSLTIGTDSETRVYKGKAEVLELITAIVIYRKGYGGRYFWTKTKMSKNKSLRDKIYQEVLLSLDVAREFVPKLKQQLNGQSSLYDLEIHIDVGEVGKTREMIKEVVGIVTGMGFVAKTKPYSYAASNIADRYN